MNGYIGTLFLNLLRRLLLTSGLSESVLPNWKVVFVFQSKFSGLSFRPNVSGRLNFLSLVCESKSSQTTCQKQN